MAPWLFPVVRLVSLSVPMGRGMYRPTVSVQLRTYLDLENLHLGVSHRSGTKSGWLLLDRVDGLQSVRARLKRGDATLETQVPASAASTWTGRTSRCAVLATQLMMPHLGCNVLRSDSSDRRMMARLSEETSSGDVAAFAVAF